MEILEKSKNKALKYDRDFGFLIVYIYIDFNIAEV